MARLYAYLLTYGSKWGSGKLHLAEADFSPACTPNTVIHCVEVTWEEAVEEASYRPRTLCRRCFGPASPMHEKWRIAVRAEQERIKI